MILWKFFKEKGIYTPFDNSDSFCFQIQNVKRWPINNIGENKEFVILEKFFNLATICESMSCYKRSCKSETQTFEKISIFELVVIFNSWSLFMYFSLRLTKVLTMVKRILMNIET